MRVYQFRHVGLAKTAIIAEKLMKSIGSPLKLTGMAAHLKRTGNASRATRMCLTQ